MVTDVEDPQEEGLSESERWTQAHCLIDNFKEALNANPHFQKALLRAGERFSWNKRRVWGDWIVSEIAFVTGDSASYEVMYDFFDGDRLSIGKYVDPDDPSLSPSPTREVVEVSCSAGQGVWSNVKWSLESEGSGLQEESGNQAAVDKVEVFLEELKEELKGYSEK